MIVLILGAKDGNILTKISILALYPQIYLNDQSHHQMLLQATLIHDNKVKEAKGAKEADQEDQDWHQLTRNLRDRVNKEEDKKKRTYIVQPEASNQLNPFHRQLLTHSDLQMDKIEVHFHQDPWPVNKEHML